MMNTPHLQAFGRHLRKIRSEKNLSQEKLGLLSDLDRTYISAVERGKRNISLLNILRLADALEVSPATLMMFEEVADA
ncbi:helix-turn-helix transcriptional regulator [uncultured Methylophaga sp.]|uniref:helix-turn-helix domain-containing protein n=1 Tax=uncultured Methylophaga sp. TaxID=285271 RepID=UPI002616CB56|nr:helix-turn-helix transcriptional regulator [uncultured Methylophaga sp.]